MPFKGSVKSFIRYREPEHASFEVSWSLPWTPARVGSGPSWFIYVLWCCVAHWVLRIIGYVCWIVFAKEYDYHQVGGVKPLPPRMERIKPVWGLRMYWISFTSSCSSLYEALFFVISESKRRPWLMCCFSSTGYSASSRIPAEERLQASQVFLYWHWTWWRGICLSVCLVSSYNSSLIPG